MDNGTVTADERDLCARLAKGEGAITAALAAAARRHRLHLLVGAGLSDREREDPVGASLARDITIAAALNAWHEEAVRTLLDSLGLANLPLLLLKGTGLAYTIYPSPHLRPRVDVDLLIRRDALDRCETLLESCGWRRAPERDSELVEPQRHYVKPGPGAALYHLDLHWKIASPRLFADAVGFDELQSRAVCVPHLGRHAKTLGRVDALFLACLHRVAHHADAVELLWLWDIHLLTERLTSEDAEQFVALARRTGMTAVCARGLQLAHEGFETAHSAEIAARLDHFGEGMTAKAEPSSTFLGGVRLITILESDLSTLPWRARLQLIGEHLFPSRAYMRARYPLCPPVLLPFAYVGRIARGAPKWLKRYQ
jgi:Uncharacterised nucleotidyltransferase